eukprot:s7604_g1.t1
MSLSHVRALKACEISRTRCYRKADSGQQEALDLLIGSMGAVVPDPPSEAETSTAIVPYKGPPARALSSSEVISSPSVGSVDPARIFAEVLAEEPVPEVASVASLLKVKCSPVKPLLKVKCSR